MAYGFCYRVGLADRAISLDLCFCTTKFYYQVYLSLSLKKQKKQKKQKKDK
jgi:hypothetical protein